MPGPLQFSLHLIGVFHDSGRGVRTIIDVYEGIGVMGPARKVTGGWIFHVWEVLFYFSVHFPLFWWYNAHLESRRDMSRRDGQIKTSSNIIRFPCSLARHYTLFKYLLCYAALLYSLLP